MGMLYVLECDNCQRRTDPSEQGSAEGWLNMHDAVSNQMLILCSYTCAAELMQKKVEDQQAAVDEAKKAAKK